MNLVFDTDILSTFGKIRRLDLLKKLFPNVRFFVPSSVYNELFKARDKSSQSKSLFKHQANWYWGDKNVREGIHCRKDKIAARREP